MKEKRKGAFNPNGIIVFYILIGSIHLQRRIMITFLNPIRIKTQREASLSLEKTKIIPINSNNKFFSLFNHFARACYMPS